VYDLSDELLLSELFSGSVAEDHAFNVGGVPATDEPFLSTGDVARRLGVTPGAVDKWVQKGQLVPTVITPGGRYRWLWSDVQRQLNERRKREEQRRREDEQHPRDE